MAFEKPVSVQTFKADADLSTKQFYFVKATGANVDVCTTGTEKILGVLQNKPSANMNAEVMLGGVSKLSCNSALTGGDLVGASADGQGAPKTAGTDTTHYVRGLVVPGGGTTASSGIATVTLIGPFRAA